MNMNRVYLLLACSLQICFARLFGDMRDINDIYIYNYIYIYVDRMAGVEHIVFKLTIAKEHRELDMNQTSF